MRKLLATLAATGLVSVAACPVAAADGLPFPVPDAGQQGVESPDGRLRYLTFPAGGGTLVAQLEQAGGRAREARYLARELTIPAVAVNGTTSGLSADGSTLILIRPRVRFPQRETELAVLDTESLRERERITLDGDFSFDAISPDGSVLYLIEYVSPRDPEAYRLRAYDLAADALRPDPILDSSESPIEMRGLPIDRVTGADGQWEYTLYDGGGRQPFLHALDTAEGTTACIDLAPLDGTLAYKLELELSEDGETVSALERGDAVARIDTETFAVTGTDDADAAEQADHAGHGDQPEEVEESTLGAWAAIALIALGVLLMASSIVRRRHTQDGRHTQGE